MFEASGYNHSRSSSSAFKDASMTGGQRSRLLKIGGICFVAFVIFYYFTSGDSAGVRDLVKGVHGAVQTIKAIFKLTCICSRSKNAGQLSGQRRDPFQCLEDDEVLEVLFER